MTENKLRNVLLLFCSVLLCYVSFRNQVVNLADFYGFIARAELLGLDNKYVWVNAYYPFGYPLLLTGLFEVIGDYLWAAECISLLSTAVIFYVILNLSRSFYEDEYVGLFSIGFLCLMPSFLLYATTENTDILNIALLMLAIKCIVSNYEMLTKNKLFLCGLLVGIAYLVRYTSLILLPAVLFWYFFFHQSLTFKTKCFGALALLGGFVIGASPQLLISLKLTGNPLFNTQYRNVWYGIYGNEQWALNWYKGDSYKSLSEVIAINPLLFLKNWAKNIGLFLDNLYRVPLFAISILGLIFCLSDNTEKNKKAWFLLICFTAFLSAISIAFINVRLVLIVVPILILFYVVGIKYLSELLSKGLNLSKSIFSYFSILLMLVLFFTQSATFYFDPLTINNENDGKSIYYVSKSLRNNGMLSHEQVLSFSFYYYDVKSPKKKMFKIPWYVGDLKEFDTYEKLIPYMKSHNFHFVIFDKRSIKKTPQIATYFDTPISEQLQEIFKNESVLVLKVK